MSGTSWEVVFDQELVKKSDYSSDEKISKVLVIKVLKVEINLQKMKY